MFDGKSYGEGIVELVKGYVEREVAPLKAENEGLKARLKELEDRPAPEAIKGEPGVSVDPEVVNEMIATEVAKAAAAIRIPQDGKDAAGIVEALKDAGELVLTLQDGRLIRTGIRDGTDGKPGKDGYSLSDFDANVSEDGRTILLSFEQEADRFEVEMKFPVPIYRGVFKEGEEYEAGDMATWGGSLWHCDEKTTDKPDAGPWRLCVKKGRDGKDAKNG